MEILHSSLLPLIPVSCSVSSFLDSGWFPCSLAGSQLIFLVNYLFFSFVLDIFLLETGGLKLLCHLFTTESNSSVLLLEHRNKGNMYAVASFMKCQGILFSVLFALVLTAAVLRPLVHYTKVMFQLCKCIPVTWFSKEISIKAQVCVY